MKKRKLTGTIAAAIFYIRSYLIVMFERNFFICLGFFTTKCKLSSYLVFWFKKDINHTFYNYIAKNYMSNLIQLCKEQVKRNEPKTQRNHSYQFQVLTGSYRMAATASFEGAMSA